MGTEGTADWHEQQEFSEIFFKLTVICREFQVKRDYFNWYHALRGKVSFVMGLLSEKEKEKIVEMLNVLHEIRDESELLRSRYYDSPKYNRNSGMEKNYHNSFYHLGDALFCFESDLDSMVNKKMPFLNIKKDTDISGL